MTFNTNNYSKILEKIAEEFDISPTKYRDAVNHNMAVANWLERGNYPDCSGELNIYPQGSFRLGTVVRPIPSGSGAEYDIDLVCELPIVKISTFPGRIKNMIGDRLKEHGAYLKMLDKEGKRCWTIIYAEKDRIGFHLDVLPSVPNSQFYSDTSIAITNKKHGIYDWSDSDPKGYAKWFEQENSNSFRLVLNHQKKYIQARAPDIYLLVEDVPDLLIRTPLQRSIQLMKRHRDVYFDNNHLNEFSPISIIITTLAAIFFQNERDVYSALANIVNQIIQNTAHIRNQNFAEYSMQNCPIRRTADGKWYIANPINPKENFADRWHEDNNARAKAFFNWIEKLKKDLDDICNAAHRSDLTELFSTAFGTTIVISQLLPISRVAANKDTPKIHISNAPKPWRRL